MFGLIVGASFFSRDTSSSHINIAIVEEDQSQAKNKSPSAVIDTGKVVASLSAAITKSLTATVGKKDNLANIFKRNGIDVKNAQAILALKQAAALRELPVGKKIILTIEKIRNDIKLKQLIYAIDDLNTLTIVSHNNGWQAQIKSIKPTVKLSYAAATIDGSLYTAASKKGISYKVVSQLANIFSSKADFRKMHRGDRFAVLYKEYTVDGKKVQKDEVVAAEITHKKQTHRMIGFTDSNGNTNYYTPEGYNNKPPLTRYPIVHYKRIASRFSPNRFHPILGVVRPHLGVDFVAPLGTPIQATGDGRVAFVGTRNGHGRTVIIKHGVYKTLYAHLSKFSENLRSGSYVKQGQIIGYVGRSGLATGHHLHYEIHINGVHRDPLKVKLPDGEMIAPEYRKKFFALSKQVLSQLDLYDKKYRVFAMNEVGEKNPKDSNT